MSKIHYGTFSYLPDLTDEEIAAQVKYALDHEWPVSIEYTDDPHPRNIYWEMWGLPMFGMKDAAAVMMEVQACRKARPDRYIKVNAFDATHGVESVVLSFIVQRPAEEPGFRLTRQEGPDRTLRYTLEPYATTRPAGDRYANVGATSVGAASAATPPIRQPDRG